MLNKLLIKKNGGIKTEDDFNHEIVACFKFQDGIVVFTGCARQGNITPHWAKNLYFS
jgi:hypothetical protein